MQAGYPKRSTYPEQCVMPGKIFTNQIQKKDTENHNLPSASTTKEFLSSYFRNLSYLLEGQLIILHDGEGELPSNRILKRATTSIEVIGDKFLFDINNDKIEDTVFIFHTVSKNIQKSSYYVASAMSLNTGYVGTNALYVGDDFLGNAFMYKNGEIIMGYTTKDATTTLKQKYFVYENNLLEEVIHK